MAWISAPTTEDRGPGINVALWVMTGIASAFLALRLYCKIRRLKSLWWDDMVLIASWAFLVAAVSISSSSISLGLGKRMSNINPENIPRIRLQVLITRTLMVFGVAWSKTSFAISLFRISGPRLTIGLWVIITSINVFMTTSAVVYWVNCTPVSKNWNFSVEGTCWSTDTSLVIAMVSAGYSGVMDLVLAFLPWQIVKKLNMAKKEKIGIAIAMGMGSLAAISSFIKCVHMRIIENADVSYEHAVIAVWAVAENATTIIAASIPVLRSLVQEFGPVSFKSNSAALKNPSEPYGKGSSNFRNTPKRTTGVVAGLFGDRDSCEDTLCSHPSSSSKLAETYNNSKDGCGNAGMYTELQGVDLRSRRSSRVFAEDLTAIKFGSR